MTATEVDAPPARPLQSPGSDPNRAEAPALEQWRQMLNPALSEQPRRRLFHERLERALAGGGAARGVLAVLSLGLDGLRPIPERHGRHTADEAVRIVVTRMMLATRVQDAVCRVGDDEFACLLERAEAARLRARRWQPALAFFDRQANL